VDFGRALPAHVDRGLLDDVVASKRLVETLAGLVRDGLFQVDGLRRIVRFNPAAERMLGYSANSIIGKEACTLLHATNVHDPFTAGASSEAAHIQLVLRDTLGEPLTVHARCVTLFEGADAEGWIVMFHTARRIDEIEQLKNELVSTVSHELKTPLSAIKAYTATLRQNPTLYESHRDEFLSVVEQQADRLARLVDDMLLVSRVESDLLLRRRLRVPLQRVLDEALRLIPINPVTHPMEPQIDDVEVSGDPDRLRDILRNLIENAVKYSPQGGPVSIKAQIVDGYTHIEVRDAGIGIDDDHLPYIFDRFYRVDSAAALAAGGSGLGLYIVNALVRAHGGTIDVRSQAGAGSSFVVRLPLR
jgi:two-component system, OmpR family, phosphate regulon sensor histidine kinase PhoR